MEKDIFFFTLFKSYSRGLSNGCVVSAHAPDMMVKC